MKNLKNSGLALVVVLVTAACAPNPVANIDAIPSASPSASVNVTGGFGSNTGNQTSVNNGTWSSGTTPNNNYATATSGGSTVTFGSTSGSIYGTNAGNPTSSPSGSSFSAGGNIVGNTGTLGSAGNPLVSPSPVNNGMWSSGTTPNNNYQTATSGGSTATFGNTSPSAANNGSAGNPWGTPSTNYLSAGGTTNGTTYSSVWKIDSYTGDVSSKKYGYKLRDSLNKDNYIDVSVTKFNKAFYVEFHSNLSYKTYVLSYAKVSENSVINDKSDLPYFMATNLSSGKYKVWLEMGDNLVDLEPITIM